MIVRTYRNEKTNYTLSAKMSGRSLGLGARDHSYEIVIKSKGKATVEMNLLHYDHDCRNLDWQPDEKKIAKIAFSGFLQLIEKAKESGWKFSKKDIRGYDSPIIVIDKNRKNARILVNYRRDDKPKIKMIAFFV